MNKHTNLPDEIEGEERDNDWIAIAVIGGLAFLYFGGHLVYYWATH